jgi:hypothetical protein
MTIMASFAEGDQRERSGPCHGLIGNCLHLSEAARVQLPRLRQPAVSMRRLDSLSLCTHVHVDIQVVSPFSILHSPFTTDVAGSRGCTAHHRACYIRVFRNCDDVTW